MKFFRAPFKIKTTIVSFMLFVAAFNSTAQTLYLKSFGSRTNKPVIYLHGGPGYNCVNFEATTAQTLADHGFYVIVYDRRGEGRSEDKDANYTFRETMDDLNRIYKDFALEKAILVGHSFGGVVATLYAEKFPEKVSSIVLVGAPVSLQETYKTIIKKSKAIYVEKNDSVSLGYISLLEQMDNHSLEYSSYCFANAMKNGFYSPKNPNEEAKKMYSTFSTNPLLINNAFKMTYDAPQGFWKNENYTTIDLTLTLQGLVLKGAKIFGLYGKDDGLYSTEQVDDLQKIIGSTNVRYFDNCSHNVFIDQQVQFMDAMKGWSK